MKRTKLKGILLLLAFFVSASAIAQKTEIKGKPIDHAVVDFLLSKNQFLLDNSSVKNNDPNRYRLLEGNYYIIKIFASKENDHLITCYKFGANDSDSFIYLLMVINPNSRHEIIGGDGLENDIIKLAKFFKEYNNISFKYKRYCFNTLIDNYMALHNGIILKKNK